jgi:1-acyl-sn-glycerol-3-phosphate acyltransferase
MTEPVDDGPTNDGPTNDGPTNDHYPVRRPVIDKSKADQEIMIPAGHRRGEVMTFGQKIVYSITYVVSVLVLRTYFRAKVRGRHNIPATGAFIASPVHRSNLDSPVVALISSRRLRFMGKESLWKNRISAWYFTAAGGFPVERATADRDALRACLVCLERGEPLIVFPEGTRQAGPVVTEMFDGPAWLAGRSQVPIVPVGIGGSARAMGKGTRFPRPSPITVVIGEPVAPPAAGANGRVPRRAVRETTERLRAELQRLFDEAQEWAGTPNTTK